MAIFGNGNIIPLVIVCFFVFTNFLLLDILLSAEEHRLESFSTFERTSVSRGTTRERGTILTNHLLHFHTEKRALYPCTGDNSTAGNYPSQMDRRRLAALPNGLAIG